jgi:hypothetical protein
LALSRGVAMLSNDLDLAERKIDEIHNLDKSSFFFLIFKIKIKNYM